MLCFDYRFERQNYGFALADHSPYEEIINQTLLKARKTQHWQDALNRFLVGLALT